MRRWESGKERFGKQKPAVGVKSRNGSIVRVTRDSGALRTINQLFMGKWMRTCAIPIRGCLTMDVLCTCKETICGANM